MELTSIIRHPAFTELIFYFFIILSFIVCVFWISDLALVPEDDDEEEE
jgi:hypothetical protein